MTGEARFKERAEAVYEVVAREQNDDGSWHKRFQISTPDQLPDQGPYGMATEGMALAVEMGTARPFTDEEFRELRGPDRSLIHVLSLEAKKGYQTHYLMIGLDLLHRMTGREDVAEVYCRAVDWFFGGSGVWNAKRGGAVSLSPTHLSTLFFGCRFCSRRWTKRGWGRGKGKSKNVKVKN